MNNARHMVQLGKKNLTLFQTLRKEKAVRAKATRSTEVPNLQESLVKVHVQRQICEESAVHFVRAEVI